MKSSSTTKPWKKAEPYILGGADTLKDTYSQTAPKIAEQTDMVLGSLNPFLQDQMQNGNEGVNAARDYNVSVLQGSLLEGNPYLNDIIQLSNDDIRNQTQAAMGVKGLTGGSDYAGLMADRISKNTMGLRFQDYNNERSRQDAAAGRAGQIASAEYLPVGGLLSSISAAGAPLDAASQYASGIGGLLGGYTKTKNKSGVGATLGGLAGAGLSGWASGGFKGL